ncbi:MAG: 2-hydroxy-3-oxopropionate reductase [Thermus sp.]|nr:2-hydroxy-3-oxopropionate reductase [Thermus sp.]
MERIGFIGLGIMGKPMAKNLLKAGYPLIIYARNPQVVEEFSKLGAQVAPGPKAVGERSTVVITILPDGPDVEAVALGPGGLIEGLQPGGLHIDMSTIAPHVARRMAQSMASKGILFLDAPVSGGQVGAEQASLSIMVGGSLEAYQRALPIFRALGKNIVHIGDVGAGQVAKACNQLVVALAIQGVAEALTLAKKSGVDAAKVREALLGGFAYSRVLELHGKRMLEGNFTPGFRIRLHRKDLRIVLETAREQSVALPATALVAQLLESMVANGEGELDHSALALLYERLAGLS